MKTLLHNNGTQHTATAQLDTQTADADGSGAEARRRQRRQQRSMSHGESREEAHESSEWEDASDADKENAGCEASDTSVDGQRGQCESAERRASGALDSTATADERPSTAESGRPIVRRSRSGAAGQRGKGSARQWQRVVEALNADNEALRSAASALDARLTAALEAQARRYDGIIQERDDEIGQLRALIESMNDTMLNNTQQLLDVQGQAEAESVPAYPTLTPGSSPLLSPNKLAVLLDDTQDILTFDAHAAHFARKPPLPPMSPIRGGGSSSLSLAAGGASGGGSASSRRTAAVLLPSLVASSTASPLKSVAASAAADAQELSAAWQRYLDENEVERERQVAALPLASPATPDSRTQQAASASLVGSSHAAQQLTRQATPRSLHASPTVAAVLSGSHTRSHTALGERLGGAVKQLVFHSGAVEQDDEETAPSSAAQSRSGAVHRRAESAATDSHTAPSRAASHARDGCAAATKDSTAPTSTARVEIDDTCLATADVCRAVAVQCAEEGESRQTLSASDARRVSAELRRLRALLDVRNEWSARMKAMAAIEALSREGGVGLWSEWPRELESLRPLLCDQLTDLRSAIVRSACRVLVALAAASALHFEREVDVYYPLLFKGLFVTIRVIRDSCDECLHTLTQRTASTRCLPALLHGTADAHSVVRDKCASYIHALLQAAAAAADVTALEPLSGDIGACIARLVADSDHNTRATARQLYRSFSAHFPRQAQTVHAAFPTQVQKALDAERKAATGKHSAQASRKKK